MGIYLNGSTAYTLYKSETVKPYFVDKSMMLKELFPLVEEGNNCICITRPRRFGKTVMANMISAFFAKECTSSDIFKNLSIGRCEEYQKYMNQYPVIHISFNELPKRCSSYEQYIERIERLLVKDIKREYSWLEIDDEAAVWDILMEVYASDPSIRFIFILDEWDFIFHRDFVTEEDKETYILFLSNLMKDRPYVRMAYMTGILPIAKYSSGSELNMFTEFTMAGSPAFSNYFGFTEAEVEILFGRYLGRHFNPQITMEGLRTWYNGYHAASGERIYNPRSVVQALRYDNLANYWTSSGPYDEIYYYIENNVDDVREDLVLMVSGISVQARIQEYAATSMNLKTKDEIFSAMVVYGFLSYENGRVSIPNKELMDKFNDVLRKSKIYRKNSGSGN